MQIKITIKGYCIETKSISLVQKFIGETIANEEHTTPFIAQEGDGKCIEVDTKNLKIDNSQFTYIFTACTKC